MPVTSRIATGILVAALTAFLLFWSEQVGPVGILIGAGFSALFGGLHGTKTSHAIKMLGGPLAGLLIWALLSKSGEDHLLCRTAGVAVWIAFWWITEAVSIYFTALIPAIAFPVLGVIPMAEIAPTYLPQIIFLFIGGFLMAFAMERWNLHQRIALRIILLVGGSPNNILLGFMLASYFLSMWILNTATVMMLLPAVLAVADQLQSKGETAKNSATPLLLGLAFASSIGGTATLIGTAPNLYFMEFFNTTYPELPPITFANWFALGFPISLVFFGICYLVLRLVYRKTLSSFRSDPAYCKEAYQKLGRIGYEESMIGGLFLLTVLLWFTAKSLHIAGLQIPGWTELLPASEYIKESTVAVGMAFLLFVIPSKKEPGRNLLTWTEAQRIPLGVILLFGGGFAMAKGISSSGLSDWLGTAIHFERGIHPLLLVVSLCLFMTFFTELTSNTASTVLVLPILQILAENLGLNPLFVMMPVVLSASFAFMLPVATPPNTLVFASDKLRVKDMMRAGIWLNLIGVILLTTMVFTLGKLLFEP